MSVPLKANTPQLFQRIPVFLETLPRRGLLFPTCFISVVQKKTKQETEVKGRVTWVKAECVCGGGGAVEGARK